jgi:RNA polymerase sigma factor (sigma-70 family)
VLTDQTPESALPDPTADHGTRELVRVGVQSLPPKQRAAVVLRYYEDLDDDAIANALNCSPATVRSQISRALTSLRGHIDLTEAHSHGGAA